MKRAKRVCCMLLALIMACGLSITALADGETGEGKITVDNPQNEQEYTAYRIFDVIYQEETADGQKVTTYAYTIKKDESSWFNDVICYMGSKWDETAKQYTGSPCKPDSSSGVYAAKGITLTPQDPNASNPAVYDITFNSGFSAAQFALYLKTCVGSHSSTGIQLEEKDEGGRKVRQAENLPFGYYFVTSTSGVLCNLTTVSPSVTIHDKNEVPFDKTADAQDVEIGQIVRYTLMGRVPDTSAFSKYIYQMSDTMSDGLTFLPDTVSVYLSDDRELVTETAGGKTEDHLLEGQYYQKTDQKKTGSTAGSEVVNGFTIEFEAIKMNEAGYTGKYLFVTYSARVNENAAASTENNKAVLTYSNDPHDGTKTTKITKEKEVYSAKIVIDKYAVDPDNLSNEGTKLSGAEFVLMDAGQTKYYYYDQEAAEGKKVVWNTLADGETLETVLSGSYTGSTKITKAVTDDGGSAEFIGLKAGTYYLVETKAPAGYNKLSSPVEITVEKQNGTVDETKLKQIAQVANNKGIELPTTGGSGVAAFYVIGSVLVLGAAILLILRKKADDGK